MPPTENKPDSTVSAPPQPGVVTAPSQPESAPSASPPEPSPVLPANNVAENAVATGLEPAPQTEAMDAASDQTVNWTASEFIAHHKSSGWYLSLALCTVLVAAFLFLITKDAIPAAVAVVAGILLAVYGTHQPRQLEYQVGPKGIGIAQKYYAYSDFRSFSVVHDGAFASIVFMPLKRFSPLTTIYCAPEDEDKIIAVLSGQLPFEHNKPDPVDTLMRRIRF